MSFIDSLVDWVSWLLGSRWLARACFTCLSVCWCCFACLSLVRVFRDIRMKKYVCKKGGVDDEQ